MMIEKSNERHYELRGYDLIKDQPDYWVYKLRAAVRELSTLVDGPSTIRDCNGEVSTATIFSELLQQRSYKCALELFIEAVDRFVMNFEPGSIWDIYPSNQLYGMWSVAMAEVPAEADCEELHELRYNMTCCATRYIVGNRFFFGSLFDLDCSEASAPSDPLGDSDVSSDDGELQTGNRVVSAVD